MMAVNIPIAPKNWNRPLRLTLPNPVVHYNLTICYEKQKDRTQALEHLDSALSGTHDKNLQADLIQLRGNLQLGVAPVAAGADIKKKIDTFNATYLQASQNTAGGSSGGENKGPASVSACEQIEALQVAVPQSPAIVFNAAKCAESDGRAGDGTSPWASI